MGKFVLDAYERFHRAIDLTHSLVSMIKARLSEFRDPPRGQRVPQALNEWLVRIRCDAFERQMDAGRERSPEASLLDLALVCTSLFPFISATHEQEGFIPGFAVSNKPLIPSYTRFQHLNLIRIAVMNARLDPPPGEDPQIYLEHVEKVLLRLCRETILPTHPAEAMTLTRMFGLELDDLFRDL